jgi:hypothetical protein
LLLGVVLFAEFVSISMEQRYGETSDFSGVTASLCFGNELEQLVPGVLAGWVVWGHGVLLSARKGNILILSILGLTEDDLTNVVK